MMKLNLFLAWGSRKSNDVNARAGDPRAHRSKVWLARAVGVLLAGAAHGHAQNSLLDTSFNPGTGAAGGLVETVVSQADGKVVICGDFTSVNGVPQGYVARLNANGSVDRGFQAHPGYWVRHMAVQPDGKIVIGGFFTHVGGVSRNRIARLNADGSLDASFDPGLGAQIKIVEGDDKDPFVFAVALQPDGKILIGGNFAQYNGVPRSGLARLNPDGSLDAEFNVGAGANSWVRSLLVQSNGQILVAGWFTSFDNQPGHRMVRLNSDGRPDPSFRTEFGDRTAVYTMAVQSDGKVLVGGHFSRVHSTPRESVARLNPDGSVDETFDPGTGANGFVESIRLQADEKIVLAGYFSLVNGVKRNRVARLHPDGSVDDTFNADLDNFAWTAEIQDDGKILVSGGFTTVDGFDRRGVARLNPGGTGMAVPRLLRPVWSRGRFRVTVPTSEGRSYTLQFRNQGSSRWGSRPPVSGNGTMLELMDTEASAGSNRIYRVLVN